MKLLFNVNKRKRLRGRHKKKRKDALHHMQEWVWPSIGGRAFLRFWEIKIKRARGSSHAIALGFAGGVFASFTPFMGLHIPLAILVSWPFGGSMIMAFIGTLVGNPWTFPLIWLWTYNLGNFILGRSDPEGLPQSLHWDDLVNEFGQYIDAYLLPMTVGGLPTGMLLAAVFYVLIYNNLQTYRKARKKFLKERRKKYVKNMTTKTKQITETLVNKVTKRAVAVDEKDESLRKDGAKTDKKYNKERSVKHED